MQRVLIPNEDWQKGPSHVNAMIAALENQHRVGPNPIAAEFDPPIDYEGIPSNPPPQRPAIIEVEPGADGRLRRCRSGVPIARDEAEEDRLRAAWTAQSEQLAALEAMDPGKNLPALGAALKRYRKALGYSYEDMNVIELGVHGNALISYSTRADELLMPDAASEIESLAISHGLFILQFGAWNSYKEDAAGEPNADLINTVANVARATEELPDLIAGDVSEPAVGLANLAAPPPLTADPEFPPDPAVQNELQRSVDNILSGLGQTLRRFGGTVDRGAEKGVEKGSEVLAEKATQFLGWSGIGLLGTLATGMPVEFSWLAPLIELLRKQQKK